MLIKIFLLVATPSELPPDEFLKEKRRRNALKRTKEQTETNRENGKLGGRPPKISDTDFASQIDAFIDKCETENLIPDDYNLLRFIPGLSPRTLDRYFSAANGNEDKDNTYNGYGEAIKKLIMYREHYNMLSADLNPKSIGMTNFRAKQGRWGHWSDKQESNSKMDIEISLKMLDTDK